jgi:hypothetical protein
MNCREILAHAIATAEGYFASGPHNGHTLPFILNNPGDLTASSVPYDSKVQGKCRFKTPEDGWLALGRELNIIASGRSHAYSPGRTMQQFALVYTGGDSPDTWLAAVLGYCDANGLTLTKSSTLAEALKCHG